MEVQGSLWKYKVKKQATCEHMNCYQSEVDG